VAGGRVYSAYADGGLLDLASGPQVKARCLQQAFRIF